MHIHTTHLRPRTKTLERPGRTSEPARTTLEPSDSFSFSPQRSDNEGKLIVCSMAAGLGGIVGLSIGQSWGGAGLVVGPLIGGAMGFSAGAILTRL